MLWKHKPSEIVSVLWLQTLLTLLHMSLWRRLLPFPNPTLSLWTALIIIALAPLLFESAVNTVLPFFSSHSRRHFARIAWSSRHLRLGKPQLHHVPRCQSRSSSRSETHWLRTGLLHLGRCFHFRGSAKRFCVDAIARQCVQCQLGRQSKRGCCSRLILRN